MPIGLPLLAARDTRICASLLEHLFLRGGFVGYDCSKGCHVVWSRGHQFGVEYIDGKYREASSGAQREQGILCRG